MERVQLWSCGGGRQSVLMLGLMKAGELPKPDIACMVDTNRERSSTWRYVNAVIRPELEALGVPFVLIDRSEFATVDLWGGPDAETWLRVVRLSERLAEEAGRAWGLAQQAETLARVKAGQPFGLPER